MSNSLLHSHYSSGGIPSEIAENFKDFFPDDGDLSYEEVLLQQVSQNEMHVFAQGSTGGGPFVDHLSIPNSIVNSIFC